MCSQLYKIWSFRWYSVERVDLTMYFLQTITSSHSPGDSTGEVLYAVAGLFEDLQYIKTMAAILTIN